MTPPDTARPQPTARQLGSATEPLKETTARVDINVQRFEHMMDRFQLRHMPSVVYVGATARGHSRRHNLVTVPTARDPSSASVARHSDAVESVNEPYVHATFHATGYATRMRLGVLCVITTIKLVYLPLRVVYSTLWHGRVIRATGIADVLLLLNILATCNTDILTARGCIVSTRRAIWRQYRKNGFAIDLVAALPLELALHGTRPQARIRWLVRMVKLTLLLLTMYRHGNMFRTALAKQVIGVDKSVVAWLFYSRFSHLVRIGGMVLAILLLAHYFACMWTWLQMDEDSDSLRPKNAVEIHMTSIYEALQLLQGQGVKTKTLEQALFGSAAVLLGSVVLAVVFGHVAILVANFSANNTAYQRKMERVFAVMGKLQLPHPVRERVHQYYEYLHTEYESLDGEVVKFAKDLSHTLELEVVLFKYMDVLVHVPHWRNCSPDFQKQLVLNLSVRVYLPDDFIMRRGEVGTECYIINRGTCKLCEYPTGNYEPPTMAMISGEDGVPAPVGTPRKPQGKLTVHPSRFSIYDADLSEREGTGHYSRVTELKRGQMIGERALLANYERSSDMRAVTYVEMCVIERETFQRILTRYPRDREVVLASIVSHVMVNVETQRVPCTLMAMVNAIAPNTSVLDAVRLVSRAMNPPESDPTIVFGVTEQLPMRLRQQVAATTVTQTQTTHNNVYTESACAAGQSSCDGPCNRTSQLPPSSNRGFLSGLRPGTASQLVQMLEDIRDRLERLDHQQQASSMRLVDPSDDIVQ